MADEEKINTQVEGVVEGAKPQEKPKKAPKGKTEPDLLVECN